MLFVIVSPDRIKDVIVLVFLSMCAKWICFAVNSKRYQQPSLQIIPTRGVSIASAIMRVNLVQWGWGFCMLSSQRKSLQYFVISYYITMGKKYHEQKVVKLFLFDLDQYKADRWPNNHHRQTNLLHKSIAYSRVDSDN